MKTQIRFLTVISMFFLIIGSANSQVLELNSLSTERGYEPVEIAMEYRFFDLLVQQAVPTSQLFLYAYHAVGGWAPIPFQIDEKNPFDPSNNVLDTTDVLIFLTKDLGDRVTLGNWINNTESQSNRRFEIEIVDPKDPSKKGWCYLFVSPTLTEQDKSPVKYLSVDAANDLILGKYYQLDYGRKWYPENIKITLQGGGNNLDFYDRTKIRFTIQFVFPITLTEDSLLIPPDSTIKYTPNSVVRLKKRVPLKFYLGGNPIRDVKFSMIFYPYSTIFSGEIGGLDQFTGIAKVKMVRMSYDLNPAALGMKFFSGDERGLSNQNISVNGDGSLDNVDTTLLKKTKNWTMATGVPGTMLTLNNVRYESNPPTITPEPYEQYLYYWDNLSGSTLPPRIVNSQYDWDTGDSLSYSDHGMAFESYALTDSFHYNSTTYFLGNNQSAATAQNMFDNQNNLLLRSVRTQSYTSGVASSDIDQLPAEFRLHPNFPNPFNPGTTITFDLPKDDRVTLQIFDIQGREIITLIDKNLKAGVHNFIWNGRDVNNNLMSSGIYICAIKTNVFSASQKMAFVK